MTIETVLDRHPMPACARTLGWRMLDARPADGWVRIGFEARPEFCNASGAIQGGFLAAMLDDAMGPAVLIASDGALFGSTIDMTVSYLVPARPGMLVGEASVIRLGRTVGFVEARLMDERGLVVARATASVRISAIARMAP